MNDKQDLTTEKMEHPRLPTATEGAAAVISSKEGCNNRSGNRQSNNHSAEPMKCPRCDSANTKFCYYNNYSLSQPRYFCKACRRYWTQGGTLRNVPVGGGCRKTKRVKTFRPSSAMDGFNPSCNPMQFINSHLDNIGGGFLNGLQHPSLPLMLHGFPPLPYPSSDIINENHHLQRFGLALSHMQEDEESMRSENTPSLISPYDIAGSSIAGITDHSDPSLLHSQNSLLHHDLSTTLDQTSLLKQLSNYSSCPPDLSLLFENTTNNNTVAVEDEHQNHHFRAFSSANLGLSSSFQAGLETQLQLQQPKQGFHLMDHHHHHHQQQLQYQHKGGERDGQLLSEERVQEHLERLKAKALLSHITNQQSSSSSNNNNSNNINHINNNNNNNNNNTNTNNTTGEPTHWVPQVMLQNGVSTNQIRAEQSWPTPWQTSNYN